MTHPFESFMGTNSLKPAIGVPGLPSPIRDEPHNGTRNSRADWHPFTSVHSYGHVVSWGVAMTAGSLVLYLSGEDLVLGPRAGYAPLVSSRWGAQFMGGS